MEEPRKRASGSNKKDIKTDEILERLESERISGPLIKLVGRFLGNSNREDFYRLYVTEDLTRYLEFSKEGTVDAERFPSGRIVVWLRAGTKVVETVSKEVPGDFLTGSIQQQAHGLGGILGAAHPMMLQIQGGCCGGTQMAQCGGTQTAGCGGTAIAGCGTAMVGCNSTLAQSTCSFNSCPVSTMNC